jgi:hypothetical protein
MVDEEVQCRKWSCIIEDAIPAFGKTSVRRMGFQVEV